jgi:HK97 family phage major capsid protein
MKTYFENVIATKEKRMGEINTMIQNSDSVDEVRSLGKEKETLAQEIKEAREKLVELEAQGMNALASYGQRTASPVDKNVDKFDTVEYREAFMNYVCRGTAIPMELRATTMTTDASAVIPTSIMNEIVQELEATGEIYAKVRKLNVQGGVQFPILSLKPTATWVTANTGTSESETQKLQANDSIVFNYYGLECKVSQTLLANVTTLEMFKSLFVPMSVEAIISAIELAIIKGTGVGQMTGITVDTRVPSKNKFEMSAEDFGTWDGWKKKVFAKMKKSYRNGTFIMAQSTFDGYIDGMVDKNGQPIGRVNYGIDGSETYRFGGKQVMTVEETLIADYETASKGDVVAIFVNLNDYAINSNMEIKVVKWEDHDTNEIKNKAIVICDGKLVDPHGVLIIKKGE